MQENIKKSFLDKYNSIGKEKFYKSLLVYGVNRIVNNIEDPISPEIKLIEYHDRFLFLYRKENNINYLEIAKLFRRAAHRIYNLMLKKNLIDRNERFLNLVG
jgi:hypothetical protein